MDGRKVIAQHTYSIFHCSELKVHPSDRCRALPVGQVHRPVNPSEWTSFFDNNGRDLKREAARGLSANAVGHVCVTWRYGFPLVCAASLQLILCASHIPTKIQTGSLVSFTVSIILQTIVESPSDWT